MKGQQEKEMFTTGSVLFQISASGVSTILLNRPEKRNAFNAEMIKKLSIIFDLLSARHDIRLIFLRGKGKVFCAGADTEWMKNQGEKSPEENEKDALLLGKMLEKLRNLPQMTIALAQGAVFGGGLGLLAASDLSFAVSETKMAFSEVRLGLIPAMITPYILEAIGAHRARSLFLSADIFTAEQIKYTGLVYQTVRTEEDLETIAEKYAQKILNNAPKAITASKKLIHAVHNKPLNAELLSLCAKELAKKRADEEAKEGLQAFAEKRRPKWVHKQAKKT